MISPDLLIQATLEAFFTRIHTDPSTLNDCFFNLPLSLRNEAIQYFSSAPIVPIFPGFPQSAEQLPCVAITLTGGQEDVQRQLIGSFAQTVPVYGLPQQIPTGQDAGLVLGGSTIIGSTTTDTTLFFENYRCGVYSINANLTQWVATLVKYGLLWGRLTLEFMGLLEQRLSVSDFSPNLQFNPDISFARGITLSCTYQNNYSVTTIDPDSILQSILVSLTNLTQQTTGWPYA